jgi:pyruvate dehydrogenase E2 component (dihydrolipoamide acetyltransferase)
VKNISYDGHQKLSTYRKIAIASWRHPRDPNTYCPTELAYENAEAFLAVYPAETAPTLTHYVAKIMAHCMEQYPQMNHVLRWGRLYKRSQVDIFISTMLRTAVGKDLTGFVIPDLPALNLAELAARSQTEADKLRYSTDPAIMRAQHMINRVPALLLRPLMLIQEFIQYTLNLSLDRLGMPSDPIGSAIITNVGALGFENAFVPLSPYCRCPVLVSVGRPHEAPALREGEVVAGKCVSITFTFDHRYADGAHGAPFFRRFQKIFENPDRFPKVFEARSASED